MVSSPQQEGFGATERFPRVHRLQRGSGGRTTSGCWLVKAPPVRWSADTEEMFGKKSKNSQWRNEKGFSNIKIWT